MPNRRRPDHRPSPHRSRLPVLVARTLASRSGALLTVLAAQFGASALVEAAGVVPPGSLGLVGPALLVGVSATWAWWDVTDHDAALALRRWAVVAAVVGTAGTALAAAEALWQPTAPWVPAWTVGVAAAALVALPAGAAVLAHRLLGHPALAR